MRIFRDAPAVFRAMAVYLPFLAMIRCGVKQTRQIFTFFRGGVNGRMLIALGDCIFLPTKKGTSHELRELRENNEEKIFRKKATARNSWTRKRQRECRFFVNRGVRKKRRELN
jgi:hypothetical protein